MTRHHLLLCLLGISACFVVDTDGRESIIGGDTAKIDQFPYQATLIDDDDSDKCGGAIIHQIFILTAAHCVVHEDNHFFRENISILVGTDDLNHRHPPADIIRVKKIYVPKDFDLRLHNLADIAILRLNRPIKFSNRVKQLELPWKNSQETYVGKTAQIAGFGWDWIKVKGTNETGGNTDSRLRFIDVDVLDYKKKSCFKFLDDEKQICARIKYHWKFLEHKPHGVCTGDSGAALVHDNIAIAILSVSPKGCNEKKRAAVYTRVSHYLNFIHDAMEDKHRDDIRTLDLIR